MTKLQNGVRIMRFRSIQHLKSSNLSEEAKKQAVIKYEASNRNSGMSTNRKSNVELAEILPLEILESKRFTSPVRVSFHSIRQRLPDMDNLSGKAVLDGIVKAGILQDDSAKQIPERPIHTAEIGKEEKTIITIETV